MKGFLLGLLCGVVLTLAVVNWRTDRPDAAVEGGVTQPESLRDSPAPVVSLAAAPPQSVLPPTQTAESIPHQSPQVGASVPTDRDVAMPALPIVAPLFADVFKSEADGIAMPSHVQVHRKFAAELEDDAWSAYMETNLRQYFQRQRGMDRIEILVLDCRATICEIQAAGFTSDIKTPANLDSDPAVMFQRIAYAIDKEPWGAELTTYGVLVTASNDRTLFVVHLVRKR